MITKNPQETIKLGQGLAKKLSAGDIVALYGDLGSGKTTFTKGIGKGLGVKDARHINSPSFVLIKEYSSRIPMYHLDLYRLNSLYEIEEVAIREYLYGNGVAIIEWAERMKGLLPKKHISVKFIIKSGNKREVRIEDFRH